MAAFSLPTSLLLSLSILVAATAAAVSGAVPGEKQAHLHFYFHEIFQGAPNATSFVVAGLGAANPSSSSPFGNIVVFDNALREGREPGSKLVGRAQGTAASASLADQAVLTTINLVFTEGKHNGSTLALVGRVGADGHADRTVVGGSGEFRMARGYAVSNLVDSISDKYIVVEFDVYVYYH